MDSQQVELVRALYAAYQAACEFVPADKRHHLGVAMALKSGVAFMAPTDEDVRNVLKRIGSTPFPDGFQDIADDAANMIYALSAMRAPDASESRNEALKKVVKLLQTPERDGTEPEWWTHMDEILENRMLTVASWIDQPDQTNPDSNGPGKLDSLKLSVGDKVVRVSGHDRHSERYIGDGYTVSESSSYCRGKIHLLGEQSGWTTFSDEGLFKVLSRAPQDPETKKG